MQIHRQLQNFLPNFLYAGSAGAPVCWFKSEKGSHVYDTHVFLWLQQKGYDSCPQRLGNGMKLNTTRPKPQALFQAWGQRHMQREKLPFLVNSVLCEICPNVISLVLSGSWAFSCLLPPGIFLQHMWLCSSVPWESGWGGDRQPEAGKEQVLFKLWPAGRKALVWLLRMLWVCEGLCNVASSQLSSCGTRARLLHWELFGPKLWGVHNELSLLGDYCNVKASPSQHCSLTINGEER